MKKFGAVRLAIWLGAVLCARGMYAADMPLTSDAHVNSAHASTNYGSLSNLYVGNGNTAFLQFDLSALPSGTSFDASQPGDADGLCESGQCCGRCIGFSGDERVG